MYVVYNELNGRIGAYIRKTRKEMGMSASALGNKLNMSQQQISRCENGKTKLTFEFMNRVLVALNKQWYHLFNEVIYNFDNEQFIFIINNERNYQSILSKISKSSL